MSSQIKVYKLIIEDDIYICGCFFLISQQIYTYNRQRLTPEQYNKIPTRSQRPNLRNKKKNREANTDLLPLPKKHANQDNLP
jgi:hypothetical protein